MGNDSEDESLSIESDSDSENFKDTKREPNQELSVFSTKNSDPHFIHKESILKKDGEQSFKFFSVKENEETGQLLVRGVGEVHLEVLRGRIQIEYGINATLGKMRVAYRESIGASQEKEVEFEKTIGGAHMYCKLRIAVESMIEDVDMSEVHRARFERV